MTGGGMAGESGSAREMRILADIIALTLDEQPGVATNALANIKARAREGGVTGGALKEAWRQLQSGGTLRPLAATQHGHDRAPAATLARARLEIAELQSQAAHAEHLRRQDLRRLTLMLHQARLLATIAGVLVGAAVTALAFRLLHGG